MSGTNGPPRRFRVDATPAIVQKVERLHQEAGVTGRATEFAVAIRRVRATLQNRARECGEPLRLYKNSGLELRVLSIRPAVVWFVVHQVQYEVAVLEVELMSPQ